MSDTTESTTPIGAEAGPPAVNGDQTQGAVALRGPALEDEDAPTEVMARPSREAALAAED